MWLEMGIPIIKQEVAKNYPLYRKKRRKEAIDLLLKMDGDVLMDHSAYESELDNRMKQSIRASVSVISMPSIHIHVKINRFKFFSMAAFV